MTDNVSATTGRPDDADALPPKGKQRTLSSYDQPTPEKRAFGLRLQVARELAGLSQGEAAERLGYAQSVQLSLWESGQRQPPLTALAAIADLYSTTADFLLGLAATPDRDPATALQRELAARLGGDLRALVAAVQVEGLRLVREFTPRMARLGPLARQAIDADLALQAVRQLNPQFDESVRGGARLAARLGELATAARSHLADLAKAERCARACPQGFLEGLLVADLPVDMRAQLMPRTARASAGDHSVDEEAHQGEATHG